MGHLRSLQLSFSTTRQRWPLQQKTCLAHPLEHQMLVLPFPSILEWRLIVPLHWLKHASTGRTCIRRGTKLKDALLWKLGTLRSFGPLQLGFPTTRQPWSLQQPLVHKRLLLSFPSFIISLHRLNHASIACTFVRGFTNMFEGWYATNIRVQWGQVTTTTWSFPPRGKDLRAHRRRQSLLVKDGTNYSTADFLSSIRTLANKICHHSYSLARSK